MLTVGLTGGIGSGKSTVAQLFAEQGVPIIDTDVIAREQVEPEKPAFSAIIEHFGKNLLAENGALNRAKLRHIIFNNDAERTWLENLLHPLIRQAVEKQLKTITAPYCIVVIPLLFEVKPYPFINRILVVDAPEHMQIERAALRDQSNKTHIQAIINTQTRREDRNSRADDIILNDGEINDLAVQVKNLHAKYLILSRNK